MTDLFFPRQVLESEGISSSLGTVAVKNSAFPWVPCPLPGPASLASRGLLPCRLPFSDESVTVLEMVIGPAARDTAGVFPALLVLAVLLHIPLCPLGLSGPQFLCLSNRMVIHFWQGCKNQR